jgi:N-acetylglutamate synthase
MSLPSPAQLDRLADAGWPALERERLGGWTLRAADGVTNRANSVLTAGDVPDIPHAVDAAQDWYARRGLPAVFQVSPATPEALATELGARGYREHSPTSILVAERAVVAAGSPVQPPAREVAVAPTPPPGWLDTWWAVDGRGGAAERATVERILAGGPALYAWSGSADAPDAVARLALVDDWGGLFAVATLPVARRRGLARSLAAALAGRAEALGVTRLWLQVLADNAGAIALYESLGFVPASRYAYWSR